ncbi:hypothetical protein CANMA_005064 [Candida margitis]|uniref:uncharacterized protein n=1 Tax=Candida margitis TaxID=1775924 RepID=UPI002227FCA0|nr:uncharacterized protein CANMA_005064 [Candida margitis]KAI5952221.1 hypothetical protein CANMA_005064 [Candida margitis]
MSHNESTSNVHLGGTKESKKRRKKSNDDYEINQWAGLIDDKLGSDGQSLDSGISPTKKRKVKRSSARESSGEYHGATLQQSDYKECNGHGISQPEFEQHVGNTSLQMSNPETDKVAGEEYHQGQYETYNSSSFPHVKSGELNEEQQARLLAAANAMVEEDMIPMSSEPETSAANDRSTTNELGNTSSRPQKFAHKKPSQVGPPDLPEYNFSGIRDVDDLIMETSRKANEWFSTKVPESKRGKPRPFTDEEDAIVDYYLAGFCHLKKWNRDDLCNRIWTNDRTKDKFWKKACKAIPYRTQSSIYKHIRRRYHIFDVRAKWSPEDDEKLKGLAVTHEGQWKTIGEVMGRMPEDCRDRWRNYIKCGPGRTLQKWTQEEETKLIDIVNEMLHSLRTKDGKDSDTSKINWTVVSERMNGARSRIQCRYKWTKLNEKQNRIALPRMSYGTKLWLLRKVAKKRVKSLDKVKWHKVMKSYLKDEPDNAGWTKDEFEAYLRDVSKHDIDKPNFLDAVNEEVTKLKSLSDESNV